MRYSRVLGVLGICGVFEILLLFVGKANFNFFKGDSLNRMGLSIKAVIFLIGFVASCFFVIFPVELKFGKKKKYVFPLDYSTAPVIVVLILFATTCIPYVVVVRGLLGADSPDWAKDETSTSYLVPYTVVILFMTLAYVCMSAEHTKAFIYIANKFSNIALSSSNPSIIGLSLFTLLSAIFTLVTSNDIVILTLTPIILQFSKKTDPRLLLPLLLAEFCSANSFSAGLLSGNPSNIILSSVFEINFTTYLQNLLIPAILSGCVVYLYCIVLAARNRRSQPVPTQTELELPTMSSPSAKSAPNNEQTTLKRPSVVASSPLPATPTVVEIAETKDEKSAGKEAKLEKGLQNDHSAKEQRGDDVPLTRNAKFALAILVLLFCLFLLSTPIQNRWSFIEFWHIAVFVFFITLIKDILFYWHDLKTIGTITKSLPWKVPLFLFAMFILVETASYYQFTLAVADVFARWVVTPVVRCGDFAIAFVFNFITCIACLIFNNLPATIFITRVISEKSVKEVLGNKLNLAMFSVAAGTNFGACILPNASLAGLMWSSLVKDAKLLKRVWLNGSLVCLLMVIVCSLVLVILS